ncbi:Protein of unknown function [Cotesia congregata]|uniref:Uncharacterized protein n=1 Tax=Cotesia congregata TaxID=51543 RepID=A0A8J2MKA5_COTCN|nr:Protein of unknown function [Cotesia congregata]
MGWLTVKSRRKPCYLRELFIEDPNLRRSERLAAKRNNISFPKERPKIVLTISLQLDSTSRGALAPPMSVLTHPGCMQATRIPSCSRSMLIDLINYLGEHYRCHGINQESFRQLFGLDHPNPREFGSDSCIVEQYIESGFSDLRADLIDHAGEVLEVLEIFKYI